MQTCEGAGTVYRPEFACCERRSGQEEWPCDDCEGVGQVPTEEEIRRRIDVIEAEKELLRKKTEQSSK